MDLWIDGKLLGAPHMDEAGFRREDYPPHAVHAEVWDGHIFLNLAAQPELLAAQLADLPEKFSPWGKGSAHIQKVCLRCEGQLEADHSNYNECLHCPILYPMLSRVSDPVSGNNDQPQLHLHRRLDGIPAAQHRR